MFVVVLTVIIIIITLGPLRRVHECHTLGIIHTRLGGLKQPRCEPCQDLDSGRVCLDLQETLAQGPMIVVVVVVAVIRCATLEVTIDVNMEAFVAQWVRMKIMKGVAFENVVLENRGVIIILIILMTMVRVVTVLVAAAMTIQDGAVVASLDLFINDKGNTGPSPRNAGSLPQGPGRRRRRILLESGHCGCGQEKGTGR